MKVIGSHRTHWAGHLLQVLLALPIAAFSLFVGFNKALAPMPVLVEHLAWTIHLPVTVGKAVGWLEMLAASVLLLSLAVKRLRRAGFHASVWIAFNHTIAAVVHISAGEWSTLPQSAVVIPLCLVLTWLCWRRTRVGELTSGLHEREGRGETRG